SFFPYTTLFRSGHRQDDWTIEVEAERLTGHGLIGRLLELRAHRETGCQHALGLDAAGNEKIPDALRRYAVEVHKRMEPLTVDGKVGVHEGVRDSRQPPAAQVRHRSSGRWVR